jgi:trehalose 6-phosphate synthase
MKEALIINPHSAEEMADAIRRALQMSRDERKRRWRSLMNGILSQDVIWWRRRFTDLLGKAPMQHAKAG